MNRIALFDLDETLYKSKEFKDLFNKSVYLCVSKNTGVNLEQAKKDFQEKQNYLQENSKHYFGTTRTLYFYYGVSIKEFGECKSRIIQKYGMPDLNTEKTNEKLRKAILNLKRFYIPVLYTNNHRNIAKLILEKLTLENVFERIYTVDDMPVNLKTRIKKGKKINKTDKKVFKYIKPSKWRLKKILEDFNADPYNCLSIGDRYYIDIKISEELGMKAFLVNSVDEVIQVCTILKNNE